jgi:uncharacterized Zn finger protein (UPF0148 family)
MTPLQANCPACGAPVAFKQGSSIVVVCEFCHSVVARTDRALEDLGKVAEIAETGSPLDLGLRGSYRSVPFELTGRAQLGHEAGGIWDEWYAAFSDGRWGWLAEAQGRFYLTFQLPAADVGIPSFEALQLGQPVAAIPISSPLMVAEKGTARAISAKGEIPWRVVPNETYAYADLSGQGQTFGTIDYSESPPLVFVGKEVTLAELGMADARAPEREARRVASAQLSCPKCGGPLELRAPDSSERVTCPNCASLLDIQEGKLKFFQALKPRAFTPLIPIGATGQIGEGKFTVIGFVTRSVTFDQTYFWFEYLLYNSSIGFRWLVQSDEHWSYVKSVPPGEVKEDFKKAIYQGKEFYIYQDATATVEYVIGEFYWKVERGQQTRAIDYIRPPDMLSIELSNVIPKSFYDSTAAPISWSHVDKQAKKSSGEINCSIGSYVTVAGVEKAFGVTGLPKPDGVGWNQPNPHKGLAKYWLAFAALLVVLAVAFTVTTGRETAFEQTFQFEALPNEDGTQTAFSAPFKLKGRKNVFVQGASAVDNTWIYFEGDLINEDTGLVQSFDVPVEYYHGVEDGESWSEGNQTKGIYLSALPAGSYTLRVEAQWERWQTPPPPLTVRIEQGVTRGIYWPIAMVLISIFPIVALVRRSIFETRRWKDSMYGAQGGNVLSKVMSRSSSSGDDDSDSD